ncbi:MAG TPA: AsmA-like C-terminal region-containing protein [Edaphocola sp.]|nr:AsmA-like C-terminal region-containing protein [Edaphocola sp.]
MQKWKKLLAYTFGIALAGLFLFWISISWYIKNHQKEIKEKIQQAISENIDGNINIKNIQTDFSRSFPFINFRIDDFSLTDSLYPIHKKELLFVEHIYIRLNLFSLLNGPPKVSKIIIENSRFNSFIDSSGYSNSYPLKPKKKNQKESDINSINFDLRNCDFKIDNVLHHKKFGFTIKKLKGSLIPQNKDFQLLLNTTTEFEGLGFNMELGSFLKNSLLKAHFDIRYQDAEKTFYIQKTKLEIDKENLDFEGKFTIDKDADFPFELKMGNKRLDYNIGKNWMSENITEKLNDFVFKNKINIHAHITGGLTENGTDPIIDIHYSTKNNEVNAFSYLLERISFSGYFNNNIDKSLPRNDYNSILAFDSITTEFSALPINAKNISLINLKEPIVKAKLKANFDAQVINNFFGEHIKVKSGQASYDLEYNGELFPKTLIAKEIYGSIQLKNIDFNYIDRNLEFKKANTQLKFLGKDLAIETFQVYSDDNDLSIKGIAKNFMAVFMKLPEQAKMDISLKSKNLNLNNYETYLVQQRKKSNKKTTSDFESASESLGDFLNRVHTVIHLDIARANYKNFKITNLKGSTDFTDSIVRINSLNINHSGGHLFLKGNIDQKNRNNPFTVNFKLEDVGVAQFFKAMNEFGFETLTHKNLEGKINLNGNISGKITENGVLVKDALKGKVNYKLEDGKLKDFSFFENIQPWFKKRDLLNIEIPEFSGEILLNDGYLNFPETKLLTSVLQVTFWGKYALVPEKESIINFNIPLGNPQKAKFKNKKNLGMLLKFNAVFHTTGKVKINVGNRTIP